jgi:hypothetical protein
VLVLAAARLVNTQTKYHKLLVALLSAAADFLQREIMTQMRARRDLCERRSNAMAWNSSR